MTTTLTDTHRVILAAAAARDDGAVFPLPDTLTIAGAARDRMLLGLRDRGLLLETPCPVGVTPCRREEDGSAFTLHITDAGLSAIGIETAEPTPGTASQNPAALADAAGVPRPASDAVPPHDIIPPPLTATLALGGLGASTGPCLPSTSKQDAILALLRQGNGSTISDLMTATGWQAHSVRGFLSGTVKKKLGLDVQSEKRDGERRYFVRATPTDGAVHG